MRPLTDLLSISREKLAFLVDGTSAPIASITPISAWIGFELGLIQDEINKIVEADGEDSVTITTSALSLFLESVKFRYCKLVNGKVAHSLNRRPHPLPSFCQIQSSCYCSCRPLLRRNANMVSFLYTEY